MAVRVKVLAGRNLLAADLNGSSDPFCVLQIGDVKAKTKKIMNTRNPDWLETKDLALAVPLSEAELLVSVFDHDLIGSNDSLGSNSIKLNKFTEGEEQIVLLPLKGGDKGENTSGIVGGIASFALKSSLGGKKKEKKEKKEAAKKEEAPKKDEVDENHGTVVLGITVLPAVPTEKAPSLKLKGPYAQKGQSCKLQVTIVGAANINATDLGVKPKSDPYGKLTIKGKEYKTKKKESTLNPVWNKTFDGIDVEPAVDAISAQVKDSDFLGGNDSLGEVQIPLAKIALGTPQVVVVRLTGGDLGENIAMAASQVADDAVAEVASTVAEQQGGAVAGAVVGKLAGKDKHKKGALEGARKNYGVIALQVLLSPQ